MCQSSSLCSGPICVVQIVNLMPNLYDGSVIMTGENGGKWRFPRVRKLRVLPVISIYQRIYDIYRCIVYLAQNCDQNWKRNCTEHTD